MDLLKELIDHINYVGSATLFVIGLYTVLTHSNLLKKVIGINIMETSIFLFFVSIGYITGGRTPIIVPGTQEVIYVNPLPSTLILTGIVVALSITAYSLSLIMRLYKEYGTLDMDEIMDLRSDIQDE